jgi:hypothetical protein
VKDCRSELQALAHAAAHFAKRVDDWVCHFEVAAREGSLTRDQVVEPWRQLELIRDALRWGPSVGVFGESQCGKSNLVSRFAKGLGARSTQEGSLLINEPHSTPASDPNPWKVEGQQGIEFARWIDPGGGRESTGIVCRFTRNTASGVPGCFMIQLVSVAELLSSMAIGFDSEVVDSGDDERAARIAQTLKQLSASPRVKDTTGVMKELWEAWRFLRQGHVIGTSARFRALDNGDDGWDDFVRDCYRKGERPQWSANSDEPSDLDRLVELLWDSRPPLTRLWRKLYAELAKLQGASSIWVSASDVCKDKPQGGNQMSLVAVDWMKTLAKDESSNCTVVVRGRGGASDERKAMSRGAIVALARELVLPAGDAPSESEESIDVLDYPGVRAENRSIDLNSEENARSHAVEVLLRGKINRLFVSAVDLHDASTLCLAVAGVGNLEAGKPMIRALRAWLDREGWSSEGDLMGDNTMLEPSAPRPQPPLVVAMTKSDLLFLKEADVFTGKIKDLKVHYCRGLDWMDQWRDGRPFSEIYWVHNPKADAAKPTASIERSVLDARVQALCQSQVFLQHVADAKKRLEAVLDNPPRDVEMLFDRIRSLTKASSRTERLAQATLGSLESLVADVNLIYIGPGDQKRTREAREHATRHVRALEGALRKAPAVSSFLRALEMPAPLAERCYRRAADITAGGDEDGVGDVEFDTYYSQLRAEFVNRLQKQISSKRDAAWIQALQGGGSVAIGGSVLEEISGRFCQLPKLDWFKGEIERAVKPLFDRFPANAMPLAALGAITAAVWNRNMVWLGEVPPAQSEPAQLPPQLRGRFAAAKSLLQHWEERLPEVYEKLVDPRQKAAQHNIKLGELRSELLGAIVAFKAVADKAHFEGGAWESVFRRVDAIEESLTDSDPEGIAE